MILNPLVEPKFESALGTLSVLQPSGNRLPKKGRALFFLKVGDEGGGGSEAGEKIVLVSNLEPSGSKRSFGTVE